MASTSVSALERAQEVEEASTSMSALALEGAQEVEEASTSDSEWALEGAQEVEEASTYDSEWELEWAQEVEEASTYDSEWELEGAQEVEEASTSESALEGTQGPRWPIPGPTTTTTTTQEVEEEMHMDTWMRVGWVRGTFLTDDAGCNHGGGATADCEMMEAEVWGRLPEDILWRVILLLPTAKLFQLHLVSRKWRQVLTSTAFREKIAAAAAAREREEPPQRMVVYVMPSDDSHLDTRGSKCYLYIDLYSFVPSGFWDPGWRYTVPTGMTWKPKGWCYTVVAATHGLVCISNGSEWMHSKQCLQQPPGSLALYEKWEPWKPWVNRYCVLNPLTRTCVVLPRVPFRPHGWVLPAPDDADASLLTIYHERPAKVATYDLAAGGAGEWALSHIPLFALPFSDDLPGIYSMPALYSLALSPGEAYWFDRTGVRVLAPGPDGQVDKAAVVDLPSVAQLGLDCSQFYIMGSSLVAHGGSMLCVARVLPVPRNGVTASPARGSHQVVCGVWRLVRDRMAWEAVAQLDASELDRLTGFRGYCVYRLVRAFAVRELVCCSLWLEDPYELQENEGPPYLHQQRFMVGFNMDRGEWEPLHPNRFVLLHKDAEVLELRPDLFLP